jgi:hypothetical protein
MSNEEIEAEILPAEVAPSFKTKAGHNKRQDVLNYLNQAAGNKVSETARIVELYAKGLTLEEISNSLSLPVTTIRSRINPFKSLFKFLEQSEDYRLVKSNLLDAAEYQMLSLMLQPSKLKKASLAGITAAFKELHNANRLTKGLSTENQARMTVKFTSQAKAEDFKD